MRKKIVICLQKVFGWGMLTVLMVGALCFLGYLLALIIGGSAAELMCVFLYERLIPVIIYAVNLLVLLGLVTMYLSGEKALTADSNASFETETGI